MHHLQYLWYIIRHKWYVFLAGIELNVPIWQLIIHDWQKFTPDEWCAYVDKFYGKFPEYEKFWVQDRFDRAWLHHIHHGPHHPQHWVLRQDKGATVVLDMPLNYRREMLADWIGASMANGNGPDVSEWYKKNGRNYPMSEKTRRWVEAELALRSYVKSP